MKRCEFFLLFSPTAYSVTVQGRNIPLPDPIQHGNPWASAPQPQQRPPPGTKVSDADFWLNATANQIGVKPEFAHTNGKSPAPAPPVPASQTPPAVAAPPAAAAGRTPALAQLRSHSIDTSEMYAWTQQQARAPTLRELANRGGPGAVQQFQSQQNGTIGSSSSSASPAAAWKPPPSGTHNPNDPFDAAWAAKAINSTNPFQQPDTVTKAFEVKL